MDITYDVTATLRAQDHGHPPIVYESHNMDARYRRLDDVCETVTARYGTGGCNVPIVLEWKDESIHK